MLVGEVDDRISFDGMSYFGVFFDKALVGIVGYPSLYYVRGGSHKSQGERSKFSSHATTATIEEAIAHLLENSKITLRRYHRLLAPCP